MSAYTGAAGSQPWHQLPTNLDSILATAPACEADGQGNIAGMGVYARRPSSLRQLSVGRWA